MGKLSSGLISEGTMAVYLKRSYTSLSRQKFLKSQIDPPDSPPKLWNDTDFASSNPVNGCQTLKLNHPVLRKLDSSTCLKQFNQAHAQLLILGLFQQSLAASCAVKKLCNLPGTLSRAVSFIRRLEAPDAFICCSIIRRYVNAGDPQRALMLYYELMMGRFVKPNHFTFPLIVKVCAEIKSVIEGEKAHCRAVKLGFELDLYVRNSLIHMYFVCGRIREARSVFDGDSCSDLVTWNSMIDGYVKNGEVEKARKLFDEMLERDIITWNSMLAGYVGIGNLTEAKSLFDAMPSKDLVSFNCMIDGFCRTENVSAARELFDQLPKPDVATWNIILALYVRCNDYTECMELFDRMSSSGDTKPNEATFVSVVTACGHLGLLEKGKLIHSYINRASSVKPDVLLLTALLTMYMKFGDMDKAREVFDQMPEKHVVTWNAMIMGYGTHGYGKKALEVFMEMEKNGQQPNDATFTCIFTTCAHTGMLVEGWWHFDKMIRVYNMKPKTEHYGCMVDLLGRAGMLEDLDELIKQIPGNQDSSMWAVLLSYCRIHKNLKLGELVGRRLIKQDKKDLRAYLLLSNLYAAEGRWDEVESVRELMEINGVPKTSGFSMAQSEESPVY